MVAGVNSETTIKCKERSAEERQECVIHVVTSTVSIKVSPLINGIGSALKALGLMVVLTKTLTRGFRKREVM